MEDSLLKSPQGFGDWVLRRSSSSSRADTTPETVRAPSISTAFRWEKDVQGRPLNALLGGWTTRQGIPARARGSSKANSWVIISFRSSRRQSWR